MKEERDEMIINSGIHTSVQQYPQWKKEAKEEGGRNKKNVEGRNVQLTRVEMKVNIREEKKKTEDIDEWREGESRVKR